MPLDILATGYPGFDYIMRVSRSPRADETAIILDPPGIPTRTPGGCPNNIAVAAARLGLRPGVIVVIGDDERGLRIREILQEEGVDTRGVRVVEGGKTAQTYLFLNQEGEHQTFYYPGVSDKDEVGLNLSGTLAEDVQWGVITVGNATHNNRVTEWFVEHGVAILWSLKNDPYSYPRQLIERLVDVSSVVVMNRTEALRLKELIQVETLEGLFSRGVESVILTLGKQGCRILEPDGEGQVDAVPPKTTVDPTGAGDAFTAGLLFGLCQGVSTVKACRFGAVVASYVLEAWGCQANLPDRSQLQERYEAVYGEPAFAR